MRRMLCGRTVQPLGNGLGRWDNVRAMDHPIRLVVTDDLRRNRLTVFFRLLLAIPLFVWLALWGIVAAVVLFVAWFAALFTGRVPQGLHGFLAGFVRYQVHVFAFVTLAADPFPGFSGSADYPSSSRSNRRLRRDGSPSSSAPALASGCVHLERPQLPDRGARLLRLVRLPRARADARGDANLLAFSVRYHAQTQAYQSLLTSRYPSLNVGLE